MSAIPIYQEWALEPLIKDNADLRGQNWGVSTFAAVPAPLIAMDDLTDLELRIFAALSELVAPGQSTPFLTSGVDWDDIARTCQITIRTAKKTIASLMERGITNLTPPRKAPRLDLAEGFDWGPDRTFVALPRNAVSLLGWMTDRDFRMFLALRTMVAGAMVRHVTMAKICEISGVCYREVHGCTRSIDAKLRTMGVRSPRTLGFAITEAEALHGIQPNGRRNPGPDARWHRIDLRPVAVAITRARGIRDFISGLKRRINGSQVSQGTDNIKNMHRSPSWNVVSPLVGMSSAPQLAVVSPLVGMPLDTSSVESEASVALFQSGSAGIPASDHSAFHAGSAAPPVGRAGGHPTRLLINPGDHMIQRRGMQDIDQDKDGPIISAVPKAESSGHPDQEPPPAPHINRVTKAPIALRRECFDLWSTRCRAMWEMSTGRPASDARTIWGSRGYTVEQPGIDVMDELIHACQANEVVPQFLFAMAPYLLPGEDHQRLRAIADILPIVQQITEEQHDIDDLKVLVGWFDDVCAAIPKGGGQDAVVPKADDILNICATLFAVVPVASAKWGSWNAFLQAKIAVKSKFVTDKLAQGVVINHKINIWDLLGPKWEPRHDIKPRRQDAWTEIRAFLGLSDDVKIREGFIPAGFRLARFHEAMAMSSYEKKRNPVVGTIADIATINKVSYLTRSGEIIAASFHYMNVKPERCLALKVTPDNFHEFRDHWFDELSQAAPPLEQYMKYGLYPEDVDPTTGVMRMANQVFHPKWSSVK